MSACCRSGEKFIISSWFILDLKGMNMQQSRRNNLKFQRMKWGPNRYKWTSLGWTKTGSGSISGPQSGVHIAWTMLTWHPINQPPPPPPRYNPPPFLSSILLCQPRSCSAISLWSSWYWGWCRYLWAEQHGKFATHAHMLASTHAFQPHLSLCPFLSVPISGFCHFIFTSCAVPQVPALNTLQLFPHDTELIWNDRPCPPHHFILLQVVYGTVFAWTTTPTGIKFKFGINKIFSGWGISLRIWTQLDSSLQSIEINKFGQFWVITWTMGRSYYCAVWYVAAGTE